MKTRNSIRMKSELESPVVLITGCGSGLGFALTESFYKLKKFRVVASTRKESDVHRLRKLFPENNHFLVRKLDITNLDERESLVSEILQHWKSIDILINNAGISYRSVVEHMDEESELHQLNINYLSPMALIRLVVPSMREKGWGKIINVSSVSGMVAMPTMASYSASKHALEGATEALWYELRPFGISVSLFQPGFIRSSSFENVYFSKKAKLSSAIEGPYADYYQNMGPFVARLMGLSLSTPQSLANRIIHFCQKKKTPLWISGTLDAGMFFWVRKLLPRRVFHKIMFWLLPKSKKWGEKFKKTSQDFKIAL